MDADPEPDITLPISSGICELVLESDDPKGWRGSTRASA